MHNSALHIAILTFEGFNELDALHYVAPVGEKEEYVSSAIKNVAPYLP